MHATSCPFAPWVVCCLLTKCEYARAVGSHNVGHNNINDTIIIILRSGPPTPQDSFKYNARMGSKSKNVVREMTILLQWNMNVSNKMQQDETVSQRSRHRSNHTQNTIPSVVAGHQFLQFHNIGPDNGSFPITQCDISRLLLGRNIVHFSANFPSTKLLLRDLLLTFGNHLHSWTIFIFQKTNQGHVGWNN